MVPASGTPAKVDYVEIYASQIAVPTAPGDLRASVVSGTRIALAWEGATGAARHDRHSLLCHRSSRHSIRRRAAPRQGVLPDRTLPLIRPQPDRPSCMSTPHPLTDPDGQTAHKTIQDLQRLKQEGKPFFLACGFIKPRDLPTGCQRLLAGRSASGRSRR
jgi:hypothetical protein